MSRTFLYARVSTADQTTANQVLEVQSAGFHVDTKRIITEKISGSVAAELRPGFAKLLDRLEDSDVLVVTKLDRLGRNAMDVRATIERLAAIGVRVHCLQLGGADLTSPAGKMIMGILTTIAEFERDLLIERTAAGLERARQDGKALGRPRVLSDGKRAEVAERLGAGETVAAVARALGVSRQTIMRLRDAAAA
ncbi:MULTISPECIES: recombinase family protein [Burkholderia]|uniref:recombinase family protein n=1 Tax=Burkholderia TaxID=32008 RepID=UPI00075DFA12|nr:MULTISPECIES: recombinase family protein [Burkholderia]KVR76137.1 hypothetical protein WK26_25610 [Burkholderia vietnamiensis]KVS39004.1 hypothetical protein WK35_28995 [Burkholderia vietnamiensis]MBR8217738.1 recombinase family protein [Burkholderia vietnamiensis]MCA8229017.1 recombinase family protein [Burkholderia vietnamiensis]QMI45075.1 recombinase family protein [Burkholderia sp. MBR-1]